ncbi:hypothetical protein OIU41_14400 [Lacticaseibacillus paracasei]|uniref:hypothetical protein n=1 Tax=Lacticaseibacillus paracasei TaxID=1597 RepID=UPI003392795C
MKLTYHAEGHDYTAAREDDGRVVMTVDDGASARGYLAGDIVRFPKGIMIDSEIIMMLRLPKEIVASL